MESLIVLGQVPGTHIEITFALWTLGCAVLLATVVVKLGLYGRLVHRTHQMLEPQETTSEAQTA